MGKVHHYLSGTFSVILPAALAGCGSSAVTASAPAASTAGSSAYKAGTYTASADGHNGPVEVSVTFTDDAIQSIEVTSQSETPHLSDKALNDLPKEIVEAQSLGVDNVSGATFTSMAIKNAVADAVDQAGGDSSALSKVPVEQETMATDDLSTDVLVIGILRGCEKRCQCHSD